MHLEYKVTIGENGRILLPAKIREHLHVSAGDQLMLILDKDLRITPIKKLVKEFQALVKSYNKNNISLVESLKESRRQDSKKEDE